MESHQLEEVARYWRERAEKAERRIAEANNSLLGSHGYFTEPDFTLEIEKLKAAHNRAINDRRAAEEREKKLREALVRVEWRGECWMDETLECVRGHRGCPDCGTHPPTHTSDCVVAAALAGAGGGTEGA